MASNAKRAATSVRALEASIAGDRACVEWIVRLTHSGPLELDDDVVVAPTGLRVSLHGVTVAEFEGDRIGSFRQYWNESELLDQLPFEAV